MSLDANDEDRFGLRGQMEIRALLHDLLHARQSISVEYGEQRESLLTTLLNVGREGFIFDFGVDPRSSDRLLAVEQLHFSCRQEGILVRFDAKAPQRVAWDGGVACWMPLPQHIVRLQRREFFRVATPVAKPINVTVTAPDGELPMHLHDLSVGGSGFTLPGAAPTLTLGDRWPGVRFRLDQGDAIRIDLIIRHVTPIGHGNTRPTTRIGVAFADLSRKHEAALQRWIIQIEQERRKLEQREP